MGDGERHDMELESTADSLEMVKDRDEQVVAVFVVHDWHDGKEVSRRSAAVEVVVSVEAAVAAGLVVGDLSSHTD